MRRLLLVLGCLLGLASQGQAQGIFGDLNGDRRITQTDDSLVQALANGASAVLPLGPLETFLRANVAPLNSPGLGDVGDALPPGQNANGTRTLTIADVSSIALRATGTSAVGYRIPSAHRSRVYPADTARLGFLDSLTTLHAARLIPGAYRLIITRRELDSTATTPLRLTVRNGSGSVVNITPSLVLDSLPRDGVNGSTIPAAPTLPAPSSCNLPTSQGQTVQIRTRYENPQFFGEPSMAYYTFTALSVSPELLILGDTSAIADIGGESAAYAQAAALQAAYQAQFLPLSRNLSGGIPRSRPTGPLVAFVARRTTAYRVGNPVDATTCPDSYQYITIPWGPPLLEVDIWYLFHEAGHALDPTIHAYGKNADMGEAYASFLANWAVLGDSTGAIFTSNPTAGSSNFTGACWDRPPFYDLGYSRGCTLMRAIWATAYQAGASLSTLHSRWTNRTAGTGSWADLISRMTAGAWTSGRFIPRWLASYVEDDLARVTLTPGQDASINTAASFTARSLTRPGANVAANLGTTNVNLPASRAAVLAVVDVTNTGNPVEIELTSQSGPHPERLVLNRIAVMVLPLP